MLAAAPRHPAGACLIDVRAANGAAVQIRLIGGWHAAQIRPVD